MLVSASATPPGGPQLRSMPHGLGARLFLILACGFLGLFGCGFAGAQDAPQGTGPQGAIEVHLRTGDKADFNGAARVRLLSTGGPAIEEGSLDGSGTARFKHLPPGTYIVEATAPGFNAARETVVIDTNWSSVAIYLALKTENFGFPAATTVAVPVLTANARDELDKGLEALRRKDMVQARKHFEKALLIAPENSDVHYLMGALEYQESNFPAAQKHLEKAVQLFPNSLQALELLGDLYCQQGQAQKAVPLLEKAVSLEDGSWKAHSTLAAAYLQLNDFAKAQQQSERAIALGNAEAGVARVLDAAALAGLGKPDAAESVLDAFIRDQPADPAVPRARDLLTELKPRQPSAVEKSPLPLNEPGGFAAIADLRPELLPSQPSAWSKPGIDELVPTVAPNVSCALPEVLAGAGKQVENLMDSLEKFEATERIEHFPVDKHGELRSPDTRSFDYIVSVVHEPHGVIDLEEYRNGSLDPKQFPASVATNGLPAMAMVFHPSMASDFDFTCEGLGQAAGRPAWQVRFQQNPKLPSRIQAYVIAGNYYPVALKGRAWIDAATYQVVRLESELVNPIPQIRLQRESLTIAYAPVQFNSQNIQLWLPARAELLVVMDKTAFYRTHAFSNFQLFTVGTNQKIGAPKESYSFTNLSDQNVSGKLTITPVLGHSLTPISVAFTIPPRQSVSKIVGPGKDLDISAELIASARFVYAGVPGTIQGAATLTSGSTLEIVPESGNSATP
jgi:tetratricopeptide (TPR) repeat protein